MHGAGHARWEHSEGPFSLGDRSLPLLEMPSLPRGQAAGSKPKPKVGIVGGGEELESKSGRLYGGGNS